MRLLTVDGGNREVVRAKRVFNRSYSHINQIIISSGLEIVPLKHEMAELCLIRVPEQLKNVCVTVMCGPFFSCMPFPPRGLHTLSHVRYTPHYNWFDTAQTDRNTRPMFDRSMRQTAFPYMVRDASKYLPCMAESEYVDSLWETKTLLPRNEIDDGRPILYKPHYGIANHHVVMGGKIDNVDHAVRAIDRSLLGPA